MLSRQNALQHYFYVHIDLTQSLSVTPYVHNNMVIYNACFSLNNMYIVIVDNKKGIDLGL